MAVKVFRDMLDEEPETDFDRMIKANVLLDMGNHKVTRKFCDENMHHDVISYHLQVTIGRTYEMQNNLVKALEVYTELRLKQDEAGNIDTFLLRRIADINEKLGDDDAAPSACARILDQDSADKKMLVKAIKMLKRFKHSTARIAYLSRLHGLYPNNNNFTMEYANAMFVNTEYKKAKDLYEQVAQGYDVSANNNDDAFIAMLKIAECTLKMDDPKTAYKMFLVLVKQDKKFKEAWTGLAKAATELGKIPEAQKAIKKAANLEKYEISRDMIGSEPVDNVLFTQTSSFRQSPERSLSKGPDVVQKPTFKYNPKTGMADKGVEKTFVDNVDSLLNGHGGTLQIGFTDGKPTGLFNDLKLFPKNKRNNEEFEKKLRDTLQNRLSGYSTLRDIRITFPKTHHVTVCEMFIAKSPVPVYVVTKNRDEEFYVRQKKDLVRLGPKEQTKYIADHFFDID
jgi:tetratricopeptide (TPR) repeat protein